MTRETRWSIDELLARYELEPSLADYFVEGAFDREVLSQSPMCLLEGIAVYEIDVVDVPAATVSKHGLTLGNKQRVVALASELSQLPPCARVHCLVDRDLDHWFETPPSTPRLRWSRFCSIEAHFLTQQHVYDVLVTTGRAKIGDADAFVESLWHTLRQLYALRLADRELKFDLDWPPIRKYLSRSDDRIEMSLDRYTSSLLSSNGKMKRRSAFEESRHAWAVRTGGDIRYSARGHDFTELLAWAMRQFGGHKEFATAAAVERLFVLLARSAASLSHELQWHNNVSSVLGQ